MPEGPVGDLYVELRGRMDKLEDVLRLARQRAGIAGDQTAKAFSDRFLGGIQTLATGGKIAIVGYTLQKITKAVMSFYNEAREAAAATRQLGLVFGETAGSAEAFATRFADAVKEDDDTIKRMLATFGMIFKQAGMVGPAVERMSRSFVEAAYKLATFAQTEPEQAFQALMMAAQGSSRSLRQFGIAISEANIKTRMAEEGLDQAGATAAEVMSRINATGITMQQVMEDGATKIRGAATAWGEFKEAVGEGLKAPIEATAEALAALGRAVITTRMPRPTREQQAIEKYGSIENLASEVARRQTTGGNLGYHLFRRVGPGIARKEMESDLEAVIQEREERRKGAERIAATKKNQEELARWEKAARTEAERPYRERARGLKEREIRKSMEGIGGPVVEAEVKAQLTEWEKKVQETDKMLVEARQLEISAAKELAGTQKEASAKTKEYTAAQERVSGAHRAMRERTLEIYGKYLPGEQTRYAMGRAYKVPGAKQRFGAFMEAREQVQELGMYGRQFGGLPSFMQAAYGKAMGKMQTLGGEFFGKNWKALAAPEESAEEKQLREANQHHIEVVQELRQLNQKLTDNPAYGVATG